MAAYTCFRPPHLLEAPASTSCPHLLLAPASTSGWGQGASGREETVLRRRTPWCTTHPLDLLTSRVLGPGTMDPEPSGSFCELGVLGTALRRRGRNQSWSLASSSSREDLWITRGGVPSGKGAVLSSLSVRTRLGPGTRDPLVQGLQLDRHRLQQQNTKKP